MSVIHQTIWAEQWPDLWFVLLVPPQGELAATAWLSRQGVTEAWHPTETVYVHAPRPPHKLIPKIKPVATGYLFTRLSRRPIWPWLFDQSRGKIMDVMRIGECPVALSDADLMQMRQIPDRLRDMRQAADEAKRIRPGDKVTILQGGMTGWSLTVEATNGGIVRLSGPMGVIEVEDSKVEKA